MESKLRDYGNALLPTFSQIGAKPVHADNPFARVGAAMSRAQQLCTRIELLADRLVGAVPEGTMGVLKGDGPGSVFDDMHSSAAVTNDHIDAAMRALDRIEGNLP
jgi:hypothetical protein